jgi:hypothetical protein
MFGFVGGGILVLGLLGQRALKTRIEIQQGKIEALELK